MINSPLGHLRHRFHLRKNKAKNIDGILRASNMYRFHNVILLFWMILLSVPGVSWAAQCPADAGAIRRIVDNSWNTVTGGEIYYDTSRDMLEKAQVLLKQPYERIVGTARGDIPSIEALFSTINGSSGVVDHNDSRIVYDFKEFSHCGWDWYYGRYGCSYLYTYTDVNGSLREAYGSLYAYVSDLFCNYDTPNHYLEFLPEQKHCAGSDGNGEEPKEGNPCSPATGEKFQAESDYNPPGLDIPSLSRAYRSHSSSTGSSSGAGWRHNYQSSLRVDTINQKPVRPYLASREQSATYLNPANACTQGWDGIRQNALNGQLQDAQATYLGNGACRISRGGTTLAYGSVFLKAGFSPPEDMSVTVITLERANGARIRFEQQGGVWVDAFEPKNRLESVGEFWVYTDGSGRLEHYDAQGRLININDSKGQITTLAYELAGIDGDGDPATLDRVTGPFGQSLSFSYAEDTTGQKRVQQVTTPDGLIQYAYDALGNLSQVTWPDGNTRQYVYENAQFPHNLTGIIDANNNRYATWSYDAEGRATVSKHADNVDQVNFTYNTDGTTTVQDALGATRTYSFELIAGTMRTTGITGDRCTSCPGNQWQSRSYDDAGNLIEGIDWNGNITRYTYNARNLQISRTEAADTLLARTITTE